MAHNIYASICWNKKHKITMVTIKILDSGSKHAVSVRAKVKLENTFYGTLPLFISSFMKISSKIQNLPIFSLFLKHKLDLVIRKMRAKGMLLTLYYLQLNSTYTFKDVSKESIFMCILNYTERHVSNWKKDSHEKQIFNEIQSNWRKYEVLFTDI